MLQTVKKSLSDYCKQWRETRVARKRCDKEMCNTVLIETEFAWAAKKIMANDLRTPSFKESFVDSVESEQDRKKSSVRSKNRFFEKIANLRQRLKNTVREIKNRRGLDRVILEARQGNGLVAVVRSNVGLKRSHRKLEQTQLKHKQQFSQTTQQWLRKREEVRRRKTNKQEINTIL